MVNPRCLPQPHVHGTYFASSNRASAWRNPCGRAERHDALFGVRRRHLTQHSLHQYRVQTPPSVSSFATFFERLLTWLHLVWLRERTVLTQARNPEKESVCTLIEEERVSSDFDLVHVLSSPPNICITCSPLLIWKFDPGKLRTNKFCCLVSH